MHAGPRTTRSCGSQREALPAVAGHLLITAHLRQGAQQSEGGLEGPLAAGTAPGRLHRELCSKDSNIITAGSFVNVLMQYTNAAEHKLCVSIVSNSA